MKFISHKAFFAIFLLIAISSYGQVKVDKVLSYSQPVVPEHFDNYRFASYYSNDKTSYNLRGFEMASPGGKILGIKINPAGYSYAMLHGNANKARVSVFPVNGEKGDRLKVEGLIAPSAIAYTPDSRNLIIADNGQLIFFDSKSLQPTGKKYQINGSPKEICISPNGYFAATLSGGGVDIYNLASGELRASFPDAGQKSIAFSPSSEKFGVLGANGTLVLYSTTDFKPIQTINDLGNATSLFFHPDENYIGVVVDNNRILFVNLFLPEDRPVVYESGVSQARFLRDGQDLLYLANVTGKMIRYRLVSGFTPNYNSMLKDMVEERMNEWMKMRPGETELEYRERVNDENIRAQRIKFTNDAATELALIAGLGDFGDATLGRYNPETGTLIISLPGMHDIYLTVPQEDMPTFGDGNNLQFSNHVYTITPENTFELLYVSVFNPTNGKTYVFDNLENQNLDFLALSDGFVSLDLIMQSSREDIELKSIKDRILDEARHNNLLSDYTTIDVDTRIEQAYDASGNRIRNYHVNFAYKVRPEGSAKEDFAPGRYKIGDSHAAESMLAIINKAFESEFAGYLKSGKELVVDITGSADALPINGAVAYDGSFGEFSDEPCYIDGELTTISVNAKSGMKTNEQLAFMRAKGVEAEMERSMPAIRSMNVKYRHNIEVAKKKGAEFRHIGVSLIFIDAF